MYSLNQCGERINLNDNTPSIYTYTHTHAHMYNMYIYIYKLGLVATGSDDEWLCVASLGEPHVQRPGARRSKTIYYYITVIFIIIIINIAHTQSWAIKLLTGQIKTNKARA